MANLLAELLRTRTTMVVDVATGADGADTLLVRSNLTGTMQLYEFDETAGLRQLTALPEVVGAARYVHGTRQAVVEVDRGGDERHQLYVVALPTSDATAPIATIDGLNALTADPRYGHHLAGISPDNSLVAYVSNRENGVDFDLWTCELSTGEHRRVYATGSYCHPASGFSPDGKVVSVLRSGPRPLDVELVLVDVATGEAREILAHPDAAAEIGPPQWVDERAFIVSSNVTADIATVVRVDLASGATTPVAGDGQFDATPIVSADGSALLVIENRGGAHDLVVHDLAHATRTQCVVLAETGAVTSNAIAPPTFSRDGARLYYTLTTPRLAGDVWVFDCADGTTRRLTDSPAPIDPADLAVAEPHEAVSFDGERIPLFLFRPAHGAATPPVVVVVHGGPESQAILNFQPVVQGLVSAGYAVVVPNVRGSTGYGKRYAGLDDTTKRLDSVRDLAAVHEWIDANGLDASRAALYGGSYGGYMVLAGLAFQPELWAAGVDIVGISNLVTFLENTSDYRRAHRECEYGSLAEDRDFLLEASPLTHVDQMRAPLFVIHGRNDPRVPVSEAEQLTRSLHDRGVRCELVIYDDEGHGLARLDNQLDAYPRAVAFLDEVLAC